MTFDPSELPEENREEILAQAEVTSAAWKFLNSFYGGDLISAWEVTHPIFRLCLSQWWTDANRRSLQNNSSAPYQVKCSTDAQGNKTSASYDTAGNLLGTTNLTTNTKNLTYKREVSNRSVCGAFAGMVCTSTDENGKTTSYTYDADGNLTSVIPPAPLGKTTYTYDNMSRPITNVNPAGTERNFSYTSDDRLFATTYNGDLAGNHISHNRDYDGMGFSYDALDRAYPNDLGSSGNGLRIRDDIYGDPLSQSVSHNGEILFMDATSDTRGNLTKTNIRSSGSITFSALDTFFDYDAGNQMLRSSTSDTATCTTGTTIAANTDCLAFNYDGRGRVDVKAFPGGTKQTTAFDASDRPTRITVKNAAGTALYDVSYNYKGTDGLDKTLLQSKTSHTEEGITAGAITTYTYDSKNRLTAATEKAGTTTTASWAYKYDNAGNRTSVTYAGESAAKERRLSRHEPGRVPGPDAGSVKCDDARMPSCALAPPSAAGRGNPVILVHSPPSIVGASPHSHPVESPVTGTLPGQHCPVAFPESGIGKLKAR
ncbi:RHS repeat protein [Arthrobacter sp. H5]|uniref:RHS repeat domain-containing protein n=1 Tax=Arthrobacter sp. H5 TaxID=1267973 RepID=UPI000482C905|nr:RHS repeat protein [Arthrobacter sp. H5]